MVLLAKRTSSLTLRLLSNETDSFIYMVQFRLFISAGQKKKKKKQKKGDYTIMVGSTYRFMFLLFQFSIHRVFYEDGRRVHD